LTVRKTRNLQMLVPPWRLGPHQDKSVDVKTVKTCNHKLLYTAHYSRQPTQRTSGSNRVRQPHQLNVNERHVHLIEIKYCEDTRPGQQLVAAQQQHADLCRLISAKAVTLHTILLGVGGTCFREHTLNQLKQLGLDQQRALKLARNLHAHSVQYAHKLVTTRRAIENKNTSHSQVLEPGAFSNPPDFH